MNKPKIIKDYDKLKDDDKVLVKELYPDGFEKHLILIKNQKGELINVLPYETEDYCYMLKIDLFVSKKKVRKEDIEESDKKELDIEIEEYQGDENEFENEE